MKIIGGGEAMVPTNLPCAHAHVVMQNAGDTLSIETPKGTIFITLHTASLEVDLNDIIEYAEIDSDGVMTLDLENDDD